jgi:hypothetical protein
MTVPVVPEKVSRFHRWAEALFMPRVVACLDDGYGKWNDALTRIESLAGELQARNITTDPRTCFERAVEFVLFEEVVKSEVWTTVDDFYCSIDDEDGDG